MSATIKPVVFVSYTGALVEKLEYAPILRALAEQGHPFFGHQSLFVFPLFYHVFHPLSLEGREVPTSANLNARAVLLSSCITSIICNLFCQVQVAIIRDIWVGVTYRILWEHSKKEKRLQKDAKFCCNIWRQSCPNGL